VDRHEHVGTLGAGGMSVHSFLDGLAVGAAFHAGAELGLIVAVVVVLHDFSDGIGTVSVLLENDASRRTAFRWLVVDCPRAGDRCPCGLRHQHRGRSARRIARLFMGFFLYVAGAELLPEAHRKESGWMVLAATLVCAAVIYGVTQVIAI
ncbi:MAG: ZIP family metal transporter, partial [Candidatus Limnocylindria bacterium]